MKEKERYIILSGRQIKDTQNQSQAFLDIETVCKLLNQQDKHIKELEEENQQLKDKLEIKLEELHIAYCGIENVKTKNGNLKAKIKQLKKQNKELSLEAQKYYEDAYCNNFQNQTAIKELEKLKEFLLEKIAEKQSCFDSGNYNDFADGVKTICELMLISIKNQIKELGGGE